MSSARFDPYVILRELQEARVYFVVIGALARVIQGSDELTRGLDLTPSVSPQNLEKLQQALENLNARRPDGKPLDVRGLDPEREPVIVLESDAGEIKIVPQPTGTRGQDDLRHRARRESLGEGLRAEVASAGDLVRMLEAHGKADPITLETMRRVIELDRGLSWDL
ncbi:MAG: hypothetical protein M3R46_00810 [Actinomycetota bacterium]|nr:hypothetical protein [Actinomycetota bacterium]